MRFKLIKKVNPMNKEEVKWYAFPINMGKIDLRPISKKIAGRSSLTSGDVENVLSNFVDELPNLLKSGFSLQLGYFGTFRLTLSSTGSLTKEGFNTRTIKPRVVFTAGKEIKRELATIHYERVREDESTHLTTPKEGEEQA